MSKRKNERGNTYWWIFGTVIVVFLGVFAWNWFAAAPQFNDDKRVVVAATIFPIADIVTNVGGDYVRVISVIPPGASPHSYTLTPQQVAQLQQANVVMAIGHGLDNFVIESITEVTESSLPTHTVDTHIQLHRFEEDHEHENEETDHNHEEESVDPHYWLSLPNGIGIAQSVKEYLQTADPTHEQQYEAQFQEYKQKLEAAHKKLQDRVDAAKQPLPFIAEHNAWSYLAQEYNLSLVGTYEAVEGQEPSPRDIVELGTIIRQNNIDIFFTEPQKQNSAAAQLMREEFGLQIGVLDPVGGIQESDTYINLIQRNVRAVQTTQE